MSKSVNRRNKPVQCIRRTILEMPRPPEPPKTKKKQKTVHEKLQYGGFGINYTHVQAFLEDDKTNELELWCMADIQTKEHEKFALDHWTDAWKDVIDYSRGKLQILACDPEIGVPKYQLLRYVGKKDEQLRFFARHDKATKIATFVVQKGIVAVD